MNPRRWFAGIGLLLGSATALAAPLTVLSAGAIEPGIRPALAAFEKASGHTVALSFAAAPQIRERVLAGASFDLVIAPPAVLDDLEKAGKIAARPPRVTIGRVGIGVAVPAEATLPDITNTEAMKKLLLAADPLIFNRASTGLYFEGLLKRMEVEVQTLPRTIREPDGAAVMEQVLRSPRSAVGIGAITEITLFRERGLQLVGPLPPEMQNFTTYTATLGAGAGAAASDAAQALLRHLAGAEAQAGYVVAGIGAVP